MVPISPVDKSAKEQEQPGTQQPGRTPQDSGPFTEVPNAHAAGVGAMGRNDEKLPSGTEGAEVEPSPDEPVY